MSDTLRIGIIIGSTRPGRVGDQVANWVGEHANRLGDAEYTVVDIADAGLPLLDEAIPASAGRYEHAHTRAWAETIEQFDGFIFVTSEYNHAPSPALLNAFSFIYREWNDKAGAIVSYGAASSGVRAADKLRSTLGELQIADVRQQLMFSFFHDFENFSVFTPGEQHLPGLQALVDQLESWAGALRGVRAAKLEAAAAA
ncbi:NADPH-dependent FMN reductase [Protaetiibacter intestinalis]|uniref:NAD(P)H-dependent oxidoreductase n=1 Tax=Protaetiibacter intestinalis TaxID=2419774 RepID=A0A387B318_9MICO|nr:NAD(P)H-dependent oxidoreductase [Protaetiibacter intestinalis]AYF97942.1 NAD(P)H-dependent oxidoreductase [Protaetiibacter intestinalis]